jgi:hypothetical protein
MLLTHHFGSVETLERARHWLTQNGIEIAKSESPEHDATRLVMRLDLAQVSAALALIDSVERSDAHGWPGFHERPTKLHAHPAPSQKLAEEQASMKATSPIHWEPHHDAPPSDPANYKVFEYMFTRWE